MLKTLGIFFLLLIGSCTYATHNLAGDITYRHLGGFTYEFTITIFADASSPAINRRDIEINYGDNTGIDTLAELSRSEIIINGNSILKRVWVGTHEYVGGAFTYIVSVEDPNRNANVVNIDNSVNTPFTIKSELIISPFSNEINNSVLLRNNPLDNACAGAIYIYNPGAFDPDGTDSIAYRIARSLGADGNVAPMYTFPPASESITVDPITGDLIWKNPNAIGLFNVAIEIIEYRDGRRIGSVLRDIQINVVPGCENNPPEIFADQLVCIEAGNSLQTNINSSDPDNDNITLTATGELFDNPISSRTAFNAGIVSDQTNASFTWNTICDDVRIQPYKLNIKAEDDAASRRGQPTNLVNFRTVNIRVIAPPPTNFTATPSGKTINLSWSNSNCTNGVGYYIYRRRDSSGFSPSTCTPGVPDGIGYTKIATIDSISTLSYVDNDKLIPGQKYCYLITSFFADDDESYASEEVCAEIDKVIPVITIVSIDSTNEATGMVRLEWSPPTQFDTIAFPSPYKYLVYEQESNSSFVLRDSTNSINDTTLLLTNRNTTNSDFNYRIDLLSLGNGRILAGQSPQAKSIFLSIEPTDNVLKLSWSVEVPWNNTSYTIFRKSPNIPTYDSLTVTTNLFYNDSNLINGLEYCYFIRSSGSYNLPSVKTPLLNFSQLTCAEPIDNIAPCPLTPVLVGDCDLGNLNLSWTLPDSTCPQDVASYRIYKSTSLTGELLLIDSIIDPMQTSYTRNNDSIAGCYSISAIDSAGNESNLSERNCIDYCPVYELPNVFTPNGDGINDFFKPIPYNNITDFRYIDSIDLIIYNRWGTEVFRTDNPAINWSGERIPEKTTTNTFDAVGQQTSLSADGVFFYVCKVFERTLVPQEPRILKGTITILNSDLELKD